MQNNAFANITLSVDTHCVSARGNQSDPNSFTWFSFHLSRGVSRFFQLIYAGSSSFFLQPVTSPWFYPMGHVESNISRSISARRCSALPLSLPPSLSLPWFSQDASPGFKPDPVVSTVTNETSYNCQQRGEFGPRSGDASFLRNCAWTSRLCSPFLRNSRQRNSPTRGLIDSRAN